MHDIHIITFYIMAPQPLLCRRPPY